MSSCSSTTSKICLTVIGFLFWAAAAGLIFLGSWVYKTYDHFNELTTANFTLVPATIVIVVGALLFIVGCIGCVAACKENKCLLAVFFSFLLIIVTGLVLAGVLGYVFRRNLKEAVEEGLEKALQKYPYGNTSTVEKDQIDYLQSELHCCGIRNEYDWNGNIPWAKNASGHVPDSCCSKVDCNTEIGSKDLYKDGCLYKLETQFQKNLYYVAGFAITFAVIQLLGMIASCILMCRSQEVRYEILGGPNSGLRV